MMAAEVAAEAEAKVMAAAEMAAEAEAAPLHNLPGTKEQQRADKESGRQPGAAE